MIEIGIWRIRIGQFSFRGMRTNITTRKTSEGKPTSAILNTRFGLVIAIVFIIALQLCGDVETNPGPGPGNEDESRLTRQTQKRLTFESRGESEGLKAIGELGKDLRGDIP